MFHINIECQVFFYLSMLFYYIYVARSDVV